MLEEHRADLRHVKLPKGPITKAWVINRMKDLRRNVDETHADTPD